ncbi:hypothetical protein QC760_000908 [Botrytis cinerea]
MPPSRCHRAAQCAQQHPAQPAQFSLASTASALSSGGVAFIATEGNLSSSVAAPQRGGGGEVVKDHSVLFVGVGGAWNRQQTAQREQGTAMIRPEDSISRQPAQSVAGDAGPSGPSQISAQTNVEELGQAFFAAQARLEVAEAEARAAQADLQVRLAKAAAAQAHAEQLEMAVANATPLPPNDEDDLDLDLSARPAQSATGGTEAIGGLGL